MSGKLAARGAIAMGLALSLSACAGQTPDQKELTGQIVGGVAGAAVGSVFGGGSGKVIATGAGAVLGSIAGGRIANNQ